MVRVSMIFYKGYWVEGYWKSSPNEPSPFPYPAGRDQPWRGLESFIRALSNVEKYLLSVKAFVRVDEERNCKLCGKSDNKGQIDFVTNESIRWPGNLKHYFLVHNMAPSKEFYTYIMNFNPEGFSHIILCPYCQRGTRAVSYVDRYRVHDGLNNQSRIEEGFYYVCSTGHTFTFNHSGDLREFDPRVNRKNGREFELDPHGRLVPFSGRRREVTDEADGKTPEIPTEIMTSPTLNVRPRELNEDIATRRT